MYPVFDMLSLLFFFLVFVSLYYIAVTLYKFSVVQWRCRLTGECRNGDSDS